VSKGEVDFTLGWECLPGEPEGPPRFHRANLYLLACREAFRTRLPDQGAQKFLDRFRVKLRIPIEDARRMMQRAREDMQNNRLEYTDHFDPEEVFRKACAFAEIGGAIEEEGKELLQALARALRIPDRQTESTLYQRALRVEALPGEVVEEETSSGLVSYTLEGPALRGPAAPPLAPPPLAPLLPTPAVAPSSSPAPALVPSPTLPVSSPGSEAPAVLEDPPSEPMESLSLSSPLGEVAPILKSASVAKLSSLPAPSGSDPSPARHRQRLQGVAVMTGSLVLLLVPTSQYLNLIRGLVGICLLWGAWQTWRTFTSED
jgi:hypothetical protein